ncbi:MAG: ATP-binding cassette domain-containing protein [Rhodobacter sp.]|jgi:thiamine transport system ATP-binding protein|nr:ATP-binding cassette domain-containing protein [Rhodobacter sp.]
MLTLDGFRIVQGDFTLSADFAVPDGAHVAVIGPSGAGKSTLLAAIAGFIAPASGRILWNGADITGTDPGARPLSIIFQDNNLFPHLTAFQNVALGLKPGLRLSAEETGQAMQALHKTGLSGLEHRKPGALSGGQQSRVALARTLVRHRPLMMLDEPFSALGPGLKAEMLDLVADLATAIGATVLMVTHDPADAVQMAGQTVLVADGIAHPPKDTAALFADPPPSLRAYL